MAARRLRRGVIAAMAAAVLIMYIVSFDDFTEAKNLARSIGVVRDLQNYRYHLKHPRLSAAEAGDGQPASEIILVEPVSVAEGADGSVYISDRGHRIWRVGSDGRARVIAGNGYKGRSTRRQAPGTQNWEFPKAWRSTARAACILRTPTTTWSRA